MASSLAVQPEAPSGTVIVSSTALVSNASLMVTGPGGRAPGTSVADAAADWVGDGRSVAVGPATPDGAGRNSTTPAPTRRTTAAAITPYLTRFDMSGSLHGPMTTRCRVR